MLSSQREIPSEGDKCCLSGALFSRVGQFILWRCLGSGNIRMLWKSNEQHQDDSFLNSAPLPPCTNTNVNENVICSPQHCRFCTMKFCSILCCLFDCIHAYFCMCIFSFMVYPVLHSGNSTQQIPLEGFQGVTRVGAGQQLCIFARSTVGSDAALKLTDQFLFCFLCVYYDLHRYYTLVKVWYSSCLKMPRLCTFTRRIMYAQLWDLLITSRVCMLGAFLIPFMFVILYLQVWKNCLPASVSLSLDS